jgi:hypothetical protein
MGDLKQLPLDNSLNAITQRIDRLEREHDGGGGGMDARIAKLEASVTHIESDISMIWTAITGIQKNMREDFRVGVGITITVALGLAWLLAKGFHWF